MHLGMSGSLSFAQGVADSGKHDHFDLVTTRGTLRLTDPRRFGAVVWSQAPDADPAAKLLAGLGLEPFDASFDGAYLHAALRRRRVAVKQALLGGAIVVGAGNIYACEALWEAQIDPRTRSDRISRPRAAVLAEAIRATLARAVELGGSTLRNYRSVEGVEGAFQLKAKVYGRAGKPCFRCGTTVRRIVQGARATFFCPGCQRR
jgi:formamidopyrimidine-DNA glycosylase